MYLEILPRLACPLCQSALTVSKVRCAEVGGREDVLCGNLRCRNCEATFPIVDGVAVLVADPFEHLQRYIETIKSQTNQQNILPEHSSRLKLDSMESRKERPLPSDYIYSHILHFIYEDQAEELFDSTLLRKLYLECQTKEVHTLTRASLPRHGEFLDVGCATGGLTLCLAKEESCLSLGVDLAFDLVLTANKLSRSKAVLAKLPSSSCVDFIVTDALNAGVRDLIWDGVIANQLVDTLPRPDLWVLQHARLLKKGGQGVFASPFEFNEAQLNLLECDPDNDSLFAHFVNGFKSAGCDIAISELDCPWLLVRGTKHFDIRATNFISAIKN